MDARPNAKGEVKIPWSTLLHWLKGVCTATKATDDEADRIANLLTVTTGTEPLLRDWLAHISTAGLEEGQHHRACLAVAVAFLCQSGRESVDVCAADLDFVWSLVLEALRSPQLSYAVNRSSQGFLAVPLSSLIEGGNIKELFRLHVWEPNGPRGVRDLGIHAHQPFLQSWILAGEGVDFTYVAHSADAAEATHAEYGVSWTENGSSKTNKSYNIQPTTSVIVNKGNPVRVVETRQEKHTRNMMYAVPANVLHRSEVAGENLYASLVFFDSDRGFFKDAPVLGPVNSTSYTAQRDPAGITAAPLAEIVESARTWEALIQQGMHHVMAGQWEEALGIYYKALHISNFSGDQHYKHTVMAKIGHMYRMLGRNELASEILETALREEPVSRLRVEITGELAVVYRHMDRLYDAKRASEDEYATAHSYNLDREICRAAGTLGMVNYQLSLTEDPSLLETAISQISERVERARKLKAEALELSVPESRAEQTEWASQREAIGLGRLSFCYQSKGDGERAIATALECLNVQLSQRDSTKIAFARCGYGLALLTFGRPEEAVAQFNIPNTCTPIIALCREPSNEHRGYISRMIAAGADLELRDEHGYSALDCAVYSGDTKTQEIIKEGLRKKFLEEAERKVDDHYYEATLRKGYRELFQDTLRPVLLDSAPGHVHQELRKVYAQTLNGDDDKNTMFDHLKFVRYTDFLDCGKIPSSADGITQQVNINANEDDRDTFIIFMSYRWMGIGQGSTPADASPDDTSRTQYQRMSRALGQFLILHPEIDKRKLGIWLDFACIDQIGDERQQAGIAALLMNLTQCNAMISLVDDEYYERSWCCLEVLMIQTLKKAYNGHLWYQHVTEGGVEVLQEGKSVPGQEIDLSRKKLSYETDRPKLMFLQRQTNLIS